MKALILAAGLGTRLRPLTVTMPKALVRYREKTLLEHALLHAAEHGFSEIILNLHHFPDQIKEFLAHNNSFGLRIHFSDESGELLETGGAMLKAAWFLKGDEPFLVRNVDIISNLNLQRLWEAQCASGALATLAVRSRVTSRHLLFGEEMELAGWENREKGERVLTRNNESLRPLAFSGIQVVDPAIFPLITETGRFSMISLYLRLSSSHRISGFYDDSTVWHDAGKSLPDSNNALNKQYGRK